MSDGFDDIKGIDDFSEKVRLAPDVRAWAVLYRDGVTDILFTGRSKVLKPHPETDADGSFLPSFQAIRFPHIQIFRADLVLRIRELEMAPEDEEEEEE